MNARLFAAVDLLVVADVRAEGRIGHHDVEARREDAVDVDEAVVVVDAAMTVAMHDHVHLGGARGAGLGVAAEDAVPCKPAHAGIDRPVLVVGGQQLPVERGKCPFDLRFLFLGFETLRLQLGPGLVLVGLDGGGDAAANVLEGADQEPSRARRGIADQLAFPRVEQTDHEVHDGPRSEELAELAAERAAEEPLEGKSLDVVAGLGEIEPLQLLDDAAEGRLGDFESVGLGEQIVSLVVVLRQIEQAIVNKRLVGHALPCATVEVVDPERAVTTRAFHVHLHEQDLRDRVERAAGVHLVHVAQDRVALEQQVLELPPIEGTELVPDLVDSLGVAPIRRLRDLVDRHEVARYSWDELEHGGVACVVRDEELAAHRTGIALALVVVPDVDVDLLGLALDHENGRPAPGLGLVRLPDHDVGARTPAPVHGPPLLIHLLERVTVVVVQVQNEFLPDPLFRLARHVPPLAVEVHPHPVTRPFRWSGGRRSPCRRYGPGLSFDLFRHRRSPSIRRGRNRTPGFPPARE